MPVYPPLPSDPLRDLESLMDGLAYLLATDSRTSGIQWILGDVGMGAPAQIPFGYISVITETVRWYTANGGQGGLAAGLDDWEIPIVLTVAFEPHRYLPPVPSIPPITSPINPTNLGLQPPYMEQPGWRNSLEITQKIKATLRTNVTVGGVATDTRIVESRYVLQSIQDTIFRATRMTIQTQQRRVRGN